VDYACRFEEFEENFRKNRSNIHEKSIKLDLIATVDDNL
jgi:hypothetical protein